MLKCFNLNGEDMKSNKIIISDCKSIKKSNKMLTLARKGLMISLCGFVLTQLSGMSARIYYNTEYSKLINEIEKNSEIVLHINNEEEKIITAYKNNEISDEEYEKQLAQVNSDENKIILAKELNDENFNQKFKDLNVAKKAKDAFAVGSSVTALAGAGFGIASLISVKRKLDQSNKEVDDYDIFM